MSVTIVDLSNVNTVINRSFELMAKTDVAGVMLKVSEGKTFDDQTFKLRAQQAAPHLRVGGYHYAHPENNTPKEEADHFLSLYKGQNGARALKVALDMEAPKASGRTLIQWARDWNGAIHSALGHWPLFYSYPAYITGTMGMTAADKPIGGGLWLAAYGPNDGNDHPYLVPAPWKAAVLHQYTSSGKMPGVTGLVDVSHGNSLAPLLAHPHGMV